MKKQHNNINLFDKDFRKQLRDNPSDAIKTNIDTVNDVEYKVVTSSKHITYFVMPDDSLYKELDNINVGGSIASSAACVSTVGSASTYGTVATITSTTGSLSTLGSAGSVGSLGSVASADS